MWGRGVSSMYQQPPELLLRRIIYPLYAVQELYYLAFRGGSGVRVWVGTSIGIYYGEVFDLPLGRRPPKRFCLTALCCEIVGPDDDPIPLGSSADILPEGGGGGHLPQYWVI